MWRKVKGTVNWLLPVDKLFSLLKMKKPIKYPQRLGASLHSPRLESEGDKMETLNRKNIRKSPPHQHHPLPPPPHQSVWERCEQLTELRESKWWEAHGLFSLFLHLGFLGTFFSSGDKQKSQASVPWRHFHFHLLPHKQGDNVVRNDEYIASGFNIFTHRECCRESRGVLDNDEKKNRFFAPLGFLYCCIYS